MASCTDIVADVTTPPKPNRPSLFRTIDDNARRKGRRAAAADEGISVGKCGLLEIDGEVEVGETSGGPDSPPATPPGSPVDFADDVVDNGHDNENDVPVGQTVVVFDWDDTLLATTVLTRQYCFDVDDETQRLPSWLKTQLEQLQDACIAAVEAAQECCDCVILLTNAGGGWVEQSGKRFMPRVTKRLKELGIQILSAQAEYGELYPGEPAEWKKAAFTKNLEGRLINLISIGDSIFERFAAQHAASIDDTQIEHVKTVKFIDSPTLAELCTELQVLQGSMAGICELKSSADWDLTLVSNGAGPCPSKTVMSQLD
jgi:hypothetical protein